MDKTTSEQGDSFSYKTVTHYYFNLDDPKRLTKAF